MFEKVKSVFAIIGAVLSVTFFTVVLFMLGRRSSVRPGSRDDSERDRRIEDGIGNCEDRAGRIEEGITRAEGGIASCEEHLRRAEEILRGAIDRSKKE